MSPPDRTHVPPDVARRLAAIAARAPADAAAAPADGRAGRVADVRVDDTAGWTPRRPAGPVRASGPAARGASHAADPRDRPDGPDGVDPTDLPEAAGPPDPPWEPSVVAALAEAAGSVPRAAAPRVRWAPGWRTTGTAVLVLALVAGGIVLRAWSAPHGEPVAVPTPAVAGGTRAGGSGGAGEHVVVHVVGAVTQPGVVRLELGARVTDAVAAAGGGLPEADLAALNLARVLADGEQLVVPVTGEVGSAPGAVHDGLVDLNTADAAALEALPGVGPVLAARIVEHRTAQPFTTVDDLDDVSGVGPALLADLRDRVRV